MLKFMWDRKCKILHEEVKPQNVRITSKEDGCIHKVHCKTDFASANKLLS